MQIVKKQHDCDTDLFLTPTYLVGLAHQFTVDVDSHLTIQGHVNLHHRGLVDGPVGFGVWASLERADSLAELSTAPDTLSPYDSSTKMDGSVSAGNITDVVQHYGEAVLDGYEYLTPGAYRVTVQGVSHSDLAPSTDGLIEVQVESGKGLNCMIIRVEDA